MPPTMGIYSIWGKEDYDSPNISLDCLLPAGFLLQIEVMKDATILSIKKHLWDEVKKSPINKFLEGSMDNYIFSCIDEEANKIEITDEGRRLCDIRPFYPVLKLVRQQSRANEEMITNAQISVVISKDLREFDQIKEPEVVEFRRETRKICAENIRSKSEKDWLDLAMCYYPPDLAPTAELPKHLRKTLTKSNFQILISVGAESLNVKGWVFQVFHDCTPGELIKLVLDKIKENSRNNKGEYILKVVGLQEYLFGEAPLSQFLHVRNAIAKEEPPKLVLVHRESIEIPRQTSSSHQPNNPPVPRRNQGTSIFDLKNRNFLITILSVSRLSNVSSAVVRACLYHGNENLCGVVATKEIKVEKSNNSSGRFDESCKFDIELRNIPRMARLCFLLYSHSDRKAATKKGPNDGSNKKVIKKKEMVPIAWVNVPVFDYKGFLRVGNHKLMMWRVTDDDELSDELLNPIGTVEMNPLKEAVCLDVTFTQHTEDGCIHYPPFDKVLEVAAQNIGGSGVLESTTDSKLAQLKALIEKDPLYTMCEQDKELMWNLRLECRNRFPQSLPKLLTCIQWNNHVDVAQMQSLLQIWQPLDPSDALELLDFHYADNSVRSFAVKHIDKMSDSELCQYLLQLVQVSKYESYLECDLIRFLLKRALNNAKIGHNLFWLLRSEMHVPSLSVKFGLILEAYCRGNISQLGELSKEVEALNNIRVISEHIKVCGLPSDKLKDELKKGLENKCKQALSLLCCPLNPRVKLKAIKIDRCKCMDSKMKPLWLVWENIDPFADDMLLMYKRGDDLRQDMLTLQILKIMDSIWQSAGLDLRMNIYNVLPTAQKEGLIEVVTQAKTLANIQLEYADFTLTSAFNKKCIFQWLQKQNSTNESFQKALNEFTLSCAGYSVATYVLGVADRHSDNIMLRRDGQLFHIDFGHILGNFKSKWGVRRERCPFVLTADFVYVIKRGQDNQESYFQEFQKLCEEAFRTLRQHSKFLIILFMMMMNTGIPEVSCIKDIEYLKETLVPHKTEQEALEHFRSKFTEALKDSWKTSLNHMCHNIKVGKQGQQVPQPRPN